ncbi:unnamed protein product [Lampetra planeri]
MGTGSDIVGTRLLGMETWKTGQGATEMLTRLSTSTGGLRPLVIIDNGSNRATLVTFADTHRQLLRTKNSFCSDCVWFHPQRPSKKDGRVTTRLQPRPGEGGHPSGASLTGTDDVKDVPDVDARSVQITTTWYMAMAAPAQYTGRGGGEGGRTRTRDAKEAKNAKKKNASPYLCRNDTVQAGRGDGSYSWRTDNERGSPSLPSFLASSLDSLDSSLVRSLDRSLVRLIAKRRSRRRGCHGGTRFSGLESSTGPARDPKGLQENHNHAQADAR